MEPDQIEKILGYKTWTDRRKIDALLEADAIMYTNLGTDSTKGDREEVRKTSRKIYQAIKKLDPIWGSFLLKSGIDV